MKRLLLTMLLGLAVVAQAQTITIGEGTGISNQVPFNTLYNYSLTEHIYLASEIEYAGNIKAISFRIAYSYNTEYTTYIDVYMKNVSRSSFADPSDYEQFAEGDRVYSGPWTIPANTDTWMTIEFDTPFAYNGTDNLLVGIDKNSDDFAIRYFKFSEVENAVLSYFSDDQHPDPCDLGSFTGFKEVISQRPNIKLVFGSTVNVDENNACVLSVYPNPAHHVVYVEGVEGETVSVYDAMGRLVMHGVCHGQIDLSGLPEGVYAIATRRGAIKFLKQ